MRKIRIGVIGVGNMGKNHVRVYSEMNNVDIAGVADTDSEKAPGVSENFGVKFLEDYRELLKLGLDAVSIAVPTSLHKKVALDAIDAGCNVLLEKPISDNMEDAKAIIEHARKKNVKLMIGHIERFNPVVTQIKKALADQDVISISITRVGPLPPRMKNVSILIDVAVHDIDIIRYVTGSEFEKILSLTSKNFSDEADTALISFKMKNGVLAHINTDWLTPFKLREMRVATREKFIVGDLISQKVTEYGKYSADGSFTVKESGILYQEPLKQEIKSFLHSIENNTAPLVTGTDGLEALKIALRCMEYSKN